MDSRSTPPVSESELFIQGPGPSLWCWSGLDILIATGATLVSLLTNSTVVYSGGFSRVLAERLSVKNVILLTLFVIVWTGMHQLMGLYTNLCEATKLRIAGRSLLASALGSVFFFLFPLFSNERPRSLFAPVVTFMIVASVASVSLRWILRSIATGVQHINGTPVRAIIVGSGPLAYRQYCSLIRTPPPRYTVLGFVDSPGAHTVPGRTTDLVIGPLSGLEEILMSTAVDEVVIALPLRSCYDSFQEAITVCERVGVAVSYHVQPFHHSVGVSHIQKRALEPHLSRHPSRIKKWQIPKDIIDYLGALAGVCFFLPVLVLTAIAIKLTSRGPVFFIQERYGLNKKKFRMFKFRTMVADAETLQTCLEACNEAQGPVFKIKDDPRVTPLGKFLRKTSIDELPQLFNVLRGDMSLVGPRPLPNRDVDRFDHSWLMRRFSVKPGLTCLWQVNGRSSTSFDKWIAYDLEYIDTWSPLLDVKILIRTIPAVIRGSGAI